MKKILISLLFVVNIFAQDSSKITIDKKDLPPDVVKKIEEVQSKKQEVQQTQKTVESVGQWVNLGKEIGTAMDQGLKSVTQTAVDLSNSPLGWYIMTMIAWKIMGSQLTGIIFGFPFAIIVFSLWFWSYRRTCTSFKTLKSKKWNSDGKRYDYEWEIIEPDVDTTEKRNRRDTTRFIHGLIFIIISIVLAVIIF